MATKSTRPRLGCSSSSIRYSNSGDVDTPVFRDSDCKQYQHRQQDSHLEEGGAYALIVNATRCHQ